MDRLDKTLQRIDKFNLDRDWNQFHSPEIYLNQFQ